MAGREFTGARFFDVTYPAYKPYADLMVSAVLAAVLAGQQAPVGPSDLVTWQEGTVGIVLSAPHGGGVRVPGSKDRVKGETIRDLNVAEVALLTGQKLTDLAGGKPYLVIAQFSRKDVDANRKPGEGYENDAAKAHYDAYHRALRAAVDECRAKYGRAILIDIHGQAKDPEAVVRGTRDGTAVARMIHDHGKGSVTGESSLFGALKKMGYKIIPDPADGELGEETFFDGGYITEHYGSHNADGIDAIQVEIGKQRVDSTLKFSRDLAAAIFGCYKAFVKPEPGHHSVGR
jgi:N-formylglutamate amidohydrolase